MVAKPRAYTTILAQDMQPDGTSIYFTTYNKDEVTSKALLFS